MSDRRLFYETIASEFDSLMTPYDLERRLSIVFDELLPRDLTGLRTLDLGCGSGWFSQRALERGAHVISLDISPSLARMTRNRTQASTVAADAARVPFASGSFDLIISSEMLEHLERPEWGIQEIGRLVTPGGVVVLTTPNRRWLWLVSLATKIGLRPYEGYENFMGFDELGQELLQVGFTVQAHCGFHPWPFQLAVLRPLSRWVDRRCGFGCWGRLMINQAMRARKDSAPAIHSNLTMPTLSSG
jgi:2-polyprenyl-3-methyl-5-hydroxy-6-metoxy-1,4-benzoquinol methylase